MLNYILVDGEPVPEPDILKWGRWFEGDTRRIANTKGEGYTISTVFLGLDHNFSGEGPPILFETMVFKNKDWDGDGKDGLPDEDCARYCTKKEAEAGHTAMVAKWSQGESEIK